MPIYKPLEKRQIRVLIVHPGGFGQPLNCNLKICSLDEKPYYDALSYTWGGLDDPKSIILNGSSWEVTSNLGQALRHLRPSDKSLNIWVDALCINQNDNEERGIQVEFMGDIYRGAAHVRAWIGPMDDYNTHLEDEELQPMEPVVKDKWNVWRLLEVFGTSNNFDCWDEKLPHNLKDGLGKTQMLSYMAESWIEPSGKQSWETLAQLLNRPYWKRVWIQQELHNNPEVLIHCGHISTPIEWWSRTYEAFDQLWEENRHVGGLEVPSDLFQIAALPMKMCALRRRFHDRLHSENHVNSLLNEQLSRGVTDPRDRIYGVMDMIGRWHNGKFKVDYNSSPPQVYTRASRSLITFFKSLDILTRIAPRPPETRLEGLPTWCPDWSNFPIIRYPDQSPDLTFIDTEHNLNAWGDNKYDASRNINCFADFSDCGMILTVYGIVVDTIRNVVRSPFTKRKTFNPDFFIEDLESIIEIARAESDSSRKETLWRTLISNREWRPYSDPYDKPAFQNAPAELGLKFDSWVAMLRLQIPNPDTSDKALSHVPENDGEAVYKFAEMALPADQQPDPGLSTKEVSDYVASWVLPFVRVCTMATTHRRFFLTEKDNMGLAPLHACPGDIVVVLYGCALPVILRPTEGHFEFVGQSYIHGWMNGEAVDLADKRELEEKFFVIH